MNDITCKTQRSRRIVLTLIGSIWLAIVTFWIYDREAPGHVDMSGYVPPQVRAGQEAVFVVSMRRNLSRHCSLTIYRNLLDSGNALRQYGGEQQVTFSGLVAREKASPGRLLIRAPIPPTMQSGPAHLLSENYYRCPFNPTTWFFPIESSMDWPFEVLPPEAKP